MPSSGFVSPYDGPKGRAWRGVIRFHDLDGVERRKKVTLGRVPMTRREAERELGRRLDEIDRGANAASRETVAAFAIRFLDVYLPSRNLKRSTEIDYRNTLERHVVPMLGAVDLAVLAARPELLDRYVLTKTREGLAPKTIGNHLSTVSKMFEVAIRWRLVSQNPVAMIDRPRVEQADTPVLTESEIARLLSAYTELEREAEGIGPDLVVDRAEIDCGGVGDRIASRRTARFAMDGRRVARAALACSAFVCAGRDGDAEEPCGSADGWVRARDRGHAESAVAREPLPRRRRSRLRPPAARNAARPEQAVRLHAGRVETGVNREVPTALARPAAYRAHP